MPPPSAARRPVARALGALLAALAAVATVGCKGSPRALERGRVADPEGRGAPSVGVVPPTPAPVVVPSDGLPPGPPPGTSTSDRGSRLARPTPLGELAPEDAPSLPEGR